jgi:transcriptional regulator with XRE-family HTH domain
METPADDPTLSFLRFTAAGLAESARQVRLGLNLTQAEVARDIGVSIGTYKKFERSGEISLMKFLEVLRVLGRLRDVPFLAFAEPKNPREAAGQARRRQRAARPRSAR